MPRAQHAARRGSGGRVGPTGPGSRQRPRPQGPDVGPRHAPRQHPPALDHTDLQPPLLVRPRRRPDLLQVERRADRIEQPWAPLPTPPCFDGDVHGDLGRRRRDDRDRHRAPDLHDGRRARATGRCSTGPSRWGTPFWTGAGLTLPRRVEAWSWSVSPRSRTGPGPTRRETRPRRRRQGLPRLAAAAGGQRLTFWDPWLPPDESYEMCGPHRGRFRAVNLSASGSIVFVIEPLRRHVHAAVRLRHLRATTRSSSPTATRTSAGCAGPPIQLPAERWRRAAEDPRAITGAISIHKRGRGSIHRTLRVEGKRGDHTRVLGKGHPRRGRYAWLFHVTDAAAARPTHSAIRGATRPVARLGASEDGAWAGSADGIRILIAELQRLLLTRRSSRSPRRRDADRPGAPHHRRDPAEPTGEGIGRRPAPHRRHDRGVAAGAGERGPRGRRVRGRVPDGPLHTRAHRCHHDRRSSSRSRAGPCVAIEYPRRRGP